MKKHFVFFLYLVTLLLLCWYSYALVDPNFTLVSHPFWESFRAVMVDIGYEKKMLSQSLYLFCVSTLTLLYFKIRKNRDIQNNENVLWISVAIGFVALLSYPFLSHDLFNYFFDAKILTFYGQNPYQYPPIHFTNDEWLRFMHWTHRTYPYGPSFLLLSLIPSILSVGKLFLTYFFYKLFNTFFYILAVYSLGRFNRKLALIFAIHPLVVIEGLINGHNDLVAVGLGLAGISLLLKPDNTQIRGGNLISVQKMVSILLLIASGLVKYITSPLVLLLMPKDLLLGQFSASSQGAIAWAKHKNTLISALLLLPILYLSLTQVTQPWYFLNIFVLLPFYPRLIDNIEIFFFALLLSYLPYIAHTGWGESSAVILKNQIILIGMVLNISYLGLRILTQSKRRN